MATAKPRVIVYIDGFNLYYGAIKGGPHRWLDLQRLCELLRPHDDLVLVRYFSALISGPHKSEQETYLRALQTLPKIAVTLGKFKTKRIKCLLTACSHSGSRLFECQEEKRTDVNIGIHLLNDAYQDSCDRFVVLSGDSDLVPAVNMVKSLFPLKQVSVYVPARDATRGAAVELRAAADQNRQLPTTLFQHAHLAASIPDGAGGFITKPLNW